MMRSTSHIGGMGVTERKADDGEGHEKPEVHRTTSSVNKEEKRLHLRIEHARLDGYAGARCLRFTNRCVVSWCGTNISQSYFEYFNELLSKSGCLPAGGHSGAGSLAPCRSTMKP